MSVRTTGDRRIAITAIASAIVAFGLMAARTGSVDLAPDEPPINLVGAVQGSCAAGERFTTRGCVTPPRITNKTEARFSTSSDRGPLSAKVMLGATVEIDGTIGPVVVLKSAQAGKEFDEAAIEAVKRWRYEPGHLGDAPARFYFTITLEFKRAGSVTD